MTKQQTWKICRPWFSRKSWNYYHLGDVNLGIKTFWVTGWVSLRFKTPSFPLRIGSRWVQTKNQTTQTRKKTLDLIKKCPKLKASVRHIKLYHLGDALKKLEFAFALVPCSNSYETHNIITIITCTGWAKSCEFLWTSRLPYTQLRSSFEGLTSD